MCTFHVSWNGATEVAFWNFYGSMDPPSIGFVELGAVNRTGFETEYIAQYTKWSYAKAFAANWTSLGELEIQETIVRVTKANDGTPGWLRAKEDSSEVRRHLRRFGGPRAGIVTPLVVVWVVFFRCGLLYFYWYWWTGLMSRYRHILDTDPPGYRDSEH
jgi:hypothetical protein